MKKLLLLSILASTPINGQEEKAPNPYQQDYSKEKAYEAIICDTYHEALPYDKPLSEPVKTVLTKFGFTEKDVHFYTATRMNGFVEKVGNNVIMLRPNFFLYLSEEEQASQIAIQLERIRKGDKSELGPKYNADLRLLYQVTAGTTVATALTLAAVYRNELKDTFNTALPFIKKGLFSKGAAIIGGCWAVNKAALYLFERQRAKKYEEYEFGALEAVGGDEWVKVLEKQITWCKINHSWLYQWYKLKAFLYMAYHPEIKLNCYQEYLKQQEVIKKNR